MTRREILQEQYEDALFALLMDDLAVSEGEKAILENDRLKKDEKFIIPKASQHKYEQTIKRGFTVQTIHTMNRGFSRIVSKVALVALSAMLLFTTAFAISPQFRANTLNFVIETFYDRTDFQFIESPSPSESEENLAPTDWIPAGYWLESQKSDSVTERIILRNDGNSEIKVSKIRGTGSTLSLDTEDAEVQTIEIHGQSAMLISKDNVIQIAWANEQEEFFLKIQGTNASEADLIAVAENFII